MRSNAHSYRNWRTKLKGGNLVVVAVEPDGIFACTRGWLWALEPDAGAIRWTNNPLCPVSASGTP